MVKKKGEKLLLPGEIIRRLPVLPVWIVTAEMWLRSHPEIKNTDGDRLKFYCATYTIDDREATMTGLKNLSGMEVDSEGRAKANMIWFEPEDATILGSIEVHKNILKVYVNSRERFQRFEKISSGIPGLRLRDVKEEDL